MEIGDIISGISDFVGIFRRRDDSSNRYSSSYWDSSLPSSKKRRNKRKKKSSVARSEKHVAPPVKKEKLLQPLWQKTEDYDPKTCQVIVSSLNKIKLAFAELAVEKLQKQQVYKAKRELARILIVKKSFALANVALDNIDPGVSPDKSAKEILEGMEPVQMERLVKFSAEMVYQIALIYGFSPRYQDWKLEVLSVFYAALLGDIAIQHGIDWLRLGATSYQSLSSEIKALIVYAIGEAACLFYEEKHSSCSNPFGRAHAFKRISRKAQNYLKPFNSRARIKKMVSKEIEKAFPIDYEQLCDLLESKSWQEADQETFEIILKLMRRKKTKLCETGLRLAYPKISSLLWISKLDYDDLDALNSVWIKNSDGHFGFAIQSQIYMETQSLDSFYQAVGWTIDSQLKSYEQLTFELDSPKGHLPGFWLYSEFPFEPDNTIANLLPVFLKYVSNLPVEVMGIDAAKPIIVNSTEQSLDIGSDVYWED